jgi:hypothetical protein
MKMSGFACVSETIRHLQGSAKSRASVVKSASGKSDQRRSGDGMGGSDPTFDVPILAISRAGPPVPTQGYCALKKFDRIRKS